MADDADYIRHGFVAERRSLLVVSFILFFYQQAGLRIDEINVFGNRVTSIALGGRLPLFGFYGGYFLVRFYQYFRIISDKWFWNAYEQQMKKLIEASSFKHFKKEFKPSGEGERLWIRFQFCTFRDDFRKNAA